MEQTAEHQIAPQDSPKKPNWPLRISKILLAVSFFSCSFGCFATFAHYQLPYALFQVHLLPVSIFAMLMFAPIHWVAIPIYLYVFYRCVRGSRGRTRYWIISAFVLTPLLILGGVINTQFGFLQTVSMDSRNYHLASYGSQLPLGPGSWRYRYGVYECDWLNILCHRLYETDDTWMGNETADLVPDDNAKTISLVIFDKAVYTYHLPSE